MEWKYLSPTPTYIRSEQLKVFQFMIYFHAHTQFVNSITPPICSKVDFRGFLLHFRQPSKHCAIKLSSNTCFVVKNELFLLLWMALFCGVMHTPKQLAYIVKQFKTAQTKTNKQTKEKSGRRQEKQSQEFFFYGRMSK